MKAKEGFEVVEIAGEYMAIPVGSMADEFHGVVALTEGAAFLLKNMNVPKNKEDLIQLLLNEYDIDKVTAEKDLEEVLQKFIEIGLIEQ